MLRGLIYCTTVAAGVIFAPFGYSLVSSSTQIPSSEVKRIGDVVLSKSSSKGSSLSLKNFDEVLEKIKNRGESVNFKDIGMKFGDQNLSPNDLLTSPEQNWKYYLAKPTGKGLEYRLSNGKIVQRFNKHDLDWTQLDHVTLDWKPFWRIGKVSVSQIAVGSCEFTRINDSSLRIRCQEFFDGQKGSGEMVQGVLTFGEQKKN